MRVSESSTLSYSEEETLIVGITGGIGSGKSVFARELGRLGARVIDADDVARELLEERVEIREAFRKAFGSGVFEKSGKLMRRELGRIVFSNPDKLETLNRILRPPLIEAVKDRISSILKVDSNAIVVVDMAILYEAGLESLFDVVVVVTAPLERREKWLSEARGWSREEVSDRNQAQMDVQKKMEKANVVIENSGMLEDLCQKAREWYRKLSRG